MHKLPDCDRCLNNAHSNFLVCAIHPTGFDSPECPDFEAEILESGELWCPDGYTFVDNQLVSLLVSTMSNNDD
jgi:hypothetical protein